MKYLVDADWIIDALSGMPAAVARLEELAPEGLAVSLIVLGELLEGAYGADDPEERVRTLHQFLAGFGLIGLNQAVMEVFARLRLNLRKQGALIPDFDLLIAATALTHDLTLLTRNVRHFSRIPGLKVLQS